MNPAADDAMNPVRSTASKVAAVLKGVSEAPEGIGVRELARAIDLDRSAVSRIVIDLRREGFLDDRPDGLCVPGVQLLAVAHRLRQHGGGQDIATALARTIAGATGETVCAVVGVGDRVQIADVTPGSSRVIARLEVGESAERFLTVARSRHVTSEPRVQNEEDAVFLSVWLGRDEASHLWGLVAAIPAARADADVVAHISSELHRARSLFSPADRGALTPRASDRS